MAYTGEEGEQITLAEAAALTATYRTNRPGSTQAHYIGRNIIEDILGQTGCVGIRVYNGEETNGASEIVFVGVDASGDDMYTGILADRTVPCPTMCGSSNPLNSAP